MLLRRCGGSWQAAPPHERRRGSRQYLSDIAEDVTEVEQILDDIIATARLDLANQQSKDPYPPLRLTPVPVAALLDALTRRFADQHAGRSLKISVDETITLDADRVMLKLALANVLDNAHKYSCPDQPIALKVVRGDDLTFAEIAVTDRGQGIASADLPHVFTPFFRTDRSRARGTGGVGLGLTLARRIVDAHGGKIAIESRVNEGTRVTICVPLSASSAVARMTTAGS